MVQRRVRRSCVAVWLMKTLKTPHLHRRVFDHAGVCIVLLRTEQAVRLIKWAIFRHVAVRRTFETLEQVLMVHYRHQPLSQLQLPCRRQCMLNLGWNFQNRERTTVT